MTRQTKLELTRRKPHVLYRHFDADNNLLYVGITQDIKTREYHHRRDSKWMSETARITTEEYPSYYFAEEAEKFAICMEVPKHNCRRWTWVKYGEGSPELARDQILRTAQYLGYWDNLARDRYNAQEEEE